MTESQIFEHISKKLSFSTKQIHTVSNFLEVGATIPFLARYRREMTGDLDEEQLRAVRDDLEYYKTLEQRRNTILNSIREQEKLTPELEKTITDCMDLTKLEDLYLPYKPKRKTRASIAREKGLEPLAQLIFDQATTKGSVEEIASTYIDVEKGVETIDHALQGANDIIAEWVNENVDVRDKLRIEFRNYGAYIQKSIHSN